MAIAQTGQDGRVVTDWPFHREADVVWRKRVDRIIDLREKQNMVMKWPKNPLSEIIVRSVNDGRLTVYEYNDSLNKSYNLEQAGKRGGRETIVSVFLFPDDPEAGTKDSLVFEPFKADRIIGYRLAEEWIFDKKYSMMRVRIIAVMPVFKRYNAAGDLLGMDYLYAIRYEDFRKLVVNQPVFNRFNDALPLTYDDFFEQRLFSSYIVKESNVFDNHIRDYPEFAEDGVDALLESERIKANIFNFEHDLWEY